MIHPLLARWFDIHVAEKDEYSAPRKPEELLCLTEKARQERSPRSLTELMGVAADERIERARRRLLRKSLDERRQLLRADWNTLLGPVRPLGLPIVKTRSTDDQAVAGAKVERIVLEVEPGMVVPLIVLTPLGVTGRAPVVVGLAQTGKVGFLKERGDELRQLIAAGVVVVLPDLRGTGETRTGSTRGRDSNDTDLSVHVQLFGETLVGERLRDLRSVLAYLRERSDVDARRMALWGDSFTPPNPPETNFKVPREVPDWPRESEPLGGLLALLGALYEDDVRAVYVAGGLVGYRGVLTHFAVLIPHDAAVPGALTTGDLCDLAGVVAPRPLRLEGMVDHLNRVQSAADLEQQYEPTVRGYAATPRALGFSERRTSAAKWLVEQMK